MKSDFFRILSDGYLLSFCLAKSTKMSYTYLLALMEALVYGIVFADFHGDICLSGWYCTAKNGYFLCSTVETNCSPRLLLFTERIFHSVSKPALTKSSTVVQFLKNKSSG